MDLGNGYVNCDNWSLANEPSRTSGVNHESEI